MLVLSAEAARAAGELDARGYRRILDMPAVPAANPCGMRYDLQVAMRGTQQLWYLRSFGVLFDLGVRRGRGKYRRWYSVGWGLVGRTRSAELLLAEAWTAGQAEIEEDFASIRSHAHRYECVADDDGCVRVAAVLRWTGGQP